MTIYYYFNKLSIVIVLDCYTYYYFIYSNIFVFYLLISYILGLIELLTDECYDPILFLIVGYILLRFPHISSCFSILSLENPLPQYLH